MRPENNGWVLILAVSELFPLPAVLASYYKEQGGSLTNDNDPPMLLISISILYVYHTTLYRLS